MAHATTQPAPTGMMSAAEGAELLRRVADLERKYEAVKNSKVDLRWAVIAAAGLTGFIFGVMLFQFMLLYDLILAVQDLLLDLIARLDERLDGIERLLREGR